MHSIRTAFLAILLALSVCCSGATAGKVAALVGATVFDGTGADPLEDAVVLIEGERIAAVGARPDVEIPPGAEIVDLTGRFIVPGLVDSHVHFFQSAGLYTRPDIIDLRHVRSYEDEVRGIRDRLDSTFRRTLASGVTAVVDMGGPFWNFEVRRRAAGNAPRVAVAGPLISTVLREQLDLGDPPIIEVKNEAEARALVQRQLEQAPDLIKIWFIVAAAGDVEKNLPIVRATIEEAHAGGKRVAIHATQLEAARAAVGAGADILVHSVDDAPVDQAFLELLESRGTLYCPTLVVYEGYAEVLGLAPDLTGIEERLGDPEVIRSWSELAAVPTTPESEARTAARVERMRSRADLMAANLRAVFAAGVTVVAGTDAGNIGTLHGPALHRELELMARAGLSPREILLSATRDAARVFAAEPEFGTIEPGRLADLLVLDADPLTDILHLRLIHRVVKGGQILDPEELIPPQPATIVQRQVSAYNARDIDAFLALFADDAVLERFPGQEEVASGQAEMRAVFERVFAASPALHCAILERVVTGRMVIDHEFVTGLREGPPVHAVAMYEVEGGLIRRVWFLPRD